MLRKLLVVAGVAVVGVATAVPAGALPANGAQFSINYDVQAATITGASMTPCPIRGTFDKFGQGPTVKVEIFLSDAKGHVLASSTNGDGGTNSFVDTAGNWIASMNVSGVSSGNYFVGADCFGPSTAKGNKGKKAVTQTYAYDLVSVFGGQGT